MTHPYPSPAPNPFTIVILGLHEYTYSVHMYLMVFSSSILPLLLAAAPRSTVRLHGAQNQLWRCAPPRFDGDALSAWTHTDNCTSLSAAAAAARSAGVESLSSPSRISFYMLQLALHYLQLALRYLQLALRYLQLAQSYL